MDANIEQLETMGFKVSQTEHTKSCEWSGKTWTYPRLVFGDYTLDWFNDRRWILQHPHSSGEFIENFSSENFAHILNYLNGDGGLITELEKFFDTRILKYCPYEDFVKIDISKMSGYMDARWCIGKEQDSYVLWRNDFAAFTDSGNGGYWQGRDMALTSENLETLVEYINENGGTKA